MKTLLCTCVGLILMAAVGSAQLAPALPARPNPGDLPIPSCLFAAWSARELPLEDLRDRVGREFIALDDSRRIHVEIVGPNGSLAVSDEFVHAYGGVVDTRWLHRVDTWIPLDFLMDLTRALPAGHRLVRPSAGMQGAVTGEGPAVMGSMGWQSGGADGTGQVIAVIDTTWGGLSSAIATGDAPASYAAINYTPNPFESSTNPHGTGCLEQAFDHAPGAKYRLYKTDSATDYFTLVQNCQDNGVNIVTRSLVTFNDGFWDDEEDLCTPIADAANSGILWVNSAGNYAQTHWEGLMNAGQGNPDIHDWVGGDETLQITVANGQALNLRLVWNDDPSGSEDYDLYLFDSAANQIASSTSPFEFFESLNWTNNTGFTANVNAVVHRFSGAATVIELFGNLGTWEYSMAASSIAPGVSCTHPNVLLVGAVAQANYSLPAGTTGIIEPFSSHGPSNSGNSLVDIVGPDATTCLSYPGGFSGTSASAPNVAGMLACLWSSVPGYNIDAITWLLLRQGSAFKDWGAAGYDQLYGHGAANLIDFAKDTRWLTKEFSNATGLSAFPVNTLSRAMTLTPSGGRIVAFPGGDFPELANPSGPLVLTKPVTIVSRAATAVFAD